jgi:hypothetical protein
MNSDGRIRCNIAPISKGYSRVSQSFLIARLTRAEQGAVPRTPVFGG